MPKIVIFGLKLAAVKQWCYQTKIVGKCLKFKGDILGDFQTLCLYLVSSLSVPLIVKP